MTNLNEIRNQWKKERAETEALIEMRSGARYEYQDRRDHLCSFLEELPEFQGWTYKEYVQAFNACMDS